MKWAIPRLRPVFSIRRTDGVLVAKEVELADGPWRRARGLLGRRELPGERALWLLPGGSVHMFGMRFSIDVAFLDARMRVLETRPTLAPWRWQRAPALTASTLELAAGRVSSVRLEPGDQLYIETPRGTEDEQKEPWSSHLDHHRGC